MKNFDLSPSLKYCAFFGVLLLAACKNNNAQLTTAENAMIKDGVTRMAANISKDLSAKGPAAWIDYFENNPGFFMASGGTLAFEDYATAKTYTLDTVAKKFNNISLSWKNITVDPLTATYASMGADFHEDLVLANGQNLWVGGYFTATAHFDGSRWRLRNMNWATKAAAKPVR